MCSGWTTGHKKYLITELKAGSDIVDLIAEGISAEDAIYKKIGKKVKRTSGLNPADYQAIRMVERRGLGVRRIYLNGETRKM